MDKKWEKECRSGSMDLSTKATGTEIGLKEEVDSFMLMEQSMKGSGTMV
jgi:hypothetical protein